MLEFSPLTAGLLESHSEQLFRLIRVSFQQPRKTLANNFVAAYSIDRPAALEWITSTGLTEKARPQELSNEQWLELFVARRNYADKGR